MVFVSYAWHKDKPDEKVLKLVATLRENGIDSYIDVMFTGERTSTHFKRMMSENLKKSDKVIIVLSEEYKKKADLYQGGVGTEYQYILEDIDVNENKYIIISFSNDFESVTPDFLRGREIIILDEGIITNKLICRIRNIPEYEFPQINKNIIVPKKNIITGYAKSRSKKNVIIAITLIIVFLISFLIFKVKNYKRETLYTDFIYEIEQTDEGFNIVNITSYEGDLDSIIIPEFIDDIPVRQININNDDLISITVPDCVISIILNGSSIENIILSDTNRNFCFINGVLYDYEMTSILFYPAKKQDDFFEIMSTVSYIDTSLYYNIYLKNYGVQDASHFFKCVDGILYNSDLTELLSIPSQNPIKFYRALDTIIQIDTYAFSYCQNLETIEIPDKLYFHFMLSFTNCISLNQINVYPTIASVPDDLITEYSSIDGVLFTDNGEILVKYPSNKPDVIYELPENVQRTDFYAFEDCGLEKVIINNELTSLAEMSFYNCKNLIEIVLPDSLSTIGSGAFSGCIKLKSIVLPDNLDGLGTGVFMGCKELEYVYINDNLDYIADDLFYGCFSLESIILPNSIESIGNRAFGHCTTLSQIRLPKYISYIGEKAFTGCKSLKFIFLPNSILSISSDSFENIEDITFSVNKGSYAYDYVINSNLNYVTE